MEPTNSSKPRKSAAISTQPKQSNSIDRAWAETFSEILYRPKKPLGEGWLTRKQIQAKFKIGKCKATALLTEQIKSGAVEMFSGGEFVNGKAVRQVWYRPTALASTQKPLGDRIQSSSGG